MTGNGSAHQEVILLDEDLHDLEAFHLYTVAAHTACHADAFHNAAGIGRVTQRARSARTVMLAMGLSAHAMESMTFYNALKTFSFRSTYYFYFIAFGKDLYGEDITKVLFYGKIAEFFYKLFGGSAGLCEVMLFCVGGVLFFLVAKSQLEGGVAIGVLCLDLRYDTGTRFNDRTSGLLAVWTEYARHPDLFTNNTFHFFKVYAFGYEDNKQTSR